jgi:hypothetical protein
MAKKIRITGLAIGAVLVLLCSLGVIFLWWREYTMPVYTLTQRALTLGTTSYVNDVTELPLEPVNHNGWVTQIGKTAGGMTVHALPEQPDHRYLAVSGLMFPETVFRREDLVPLGLQDLRVTAIELSENVGLWPLLKTTHDGAIIENVCEALLHHRPAENAVVSYYPYHIHLVSEQLPGLVYVVDVAVDDRTVYVAERMVSSQWLKVEGAFAEWVVDK